MFLKGSDAYLRRASMSEVKMHGLALRAVQLFVIDCYGPDKWTAVCLTADLHVHEFESMLEYDDQLTENLCVGLEEVLERPLQELFEDLGTYLASHPNVEALRRLLRFGGVTFPEFLHSLDDLPDRARLAVAEMELPKLETREHSSCHFSLTCQGKIPGFGHVMVGILRTMADDYGALVFVEHRGASQGTEILAITLLEATYAEGRSFDLAGRVA